MKARINALDDTCRERICFPMLQLCGVARPRTLITMLFLSSSLLVFIAFIAGCVVASDADLDGTLQFAAMLSTLYYIGLTTSGFLILRKYKAPLTVGILIGLVFVMANLCLMLCAIFANIADVLDDVSFEKKSLFHPLTESNDLYVLFSDSKKKKDEEDQPYEAFATFQFFLFTVYSIFGVSLTVFRNHLIEEPYSNQDEGVYNDGGEKMPPPVYN